VAVPEPAAAVVADDHAGVPVPELTPLVVVLPVRPSMVPVSWAAKVPSGEGHCARGHPGAGERAGEGLDRRVRGGARVG
jgi:hypothetical protein